MRKNNGRKGFTLIELMIVVAIIIILAAVAIPNYLRMTDRARRSRVAGDFSSIATALEAYQVDWGTYPDDAAAATGLSGSFGKNNTDTMIYHELIGDDQATLNQKGSNNLTLTGEPAGIEYIKAGTLAAMYNPFNPNDTNDYFYCSSPTGKHWVLAVQYNATDILYRTDMITDLKQAAEADVTAITIGDDGTVTP